MVYENREGCFQVKHSSRHTDEDAYMSKPNSAMQKAEKILSEAAVKNTKKEKPYKTKTCWRRRESKNVIEKWECRAINPQRLEENKREICFMFLQMFRLSDLVLHTPHN